MTDQTNAPAQDSPQTDEILDSEDNAVNKNGWLDDAGGACVNELDSLEELSDLQEELSALHIDNQADEGDSGSEGFAPMIWR